jgi:hypothetical protein
MRVGILGDLHGAFEALENVMARERDVPLWLSVGDIASDTGAYPTPSRPFYFIKGNNENFDVLARLAAGKSVAANLHLVPNGRLVELSGVRVAGLGGTFAPKWYDTAAHDLPYPGAALSAAAAGLSAGSSGSSARASGSSAGPSHASAATSRAAGARASGSRAVRDDKRRHFVHAEVEACAALSNVDIFLSHEAPRPYWVGVGRSRNDAGKTVVNEVLGAMKPRLHFFGHHHRFSEGHPQDVPSIGLPLITDGYVIVDTGTWRWTMRS